MQRYFYGDTVKEFFAKTSDEIMGLLATNNPFSLDVTQRDAWIEQIEVLRLALVSHNQNGQIYFEYSIPRLGRRVDVILLLEGILFVIEFKVGEQTYPSGAIDQVWDYALDLKNFHETSHELTIVPILVSTKAPLPPIDFVQSQHGDAVLQPVKSNSASLNKIIESSIHTFGGETNRSEAWENGRYSPTPTIIEAAQALYGGHTVDAISRCDAAATNLTATTGTIEKIIREAKSERRKCVCFVTGVPGAGKTLVGLDVATRHTNKDNELNSVFLSGNGPLVSVLREALARDKVQRSNDRGQRVKKGEALREVKSFIQNVHHFRDECLADRDRPPIEHVAIFDEAQRAWNLQQTTNFMQRRKRVANFHASEPEFLISCLDRHDDWAVVVCLVGGGQEINTGEAGIQEWIEAIVRSFPDWKIIMSSRLTDTEYGSGDAIEMVEQRGQFAFVDNLHLGVSMRSFRAENVSRLVKEILDCELELAKETLGTVNEKYPIVLSRSLTDAKKWILSQARGGERYGVVVSSKAQRLKPHAIDVRVSINPIHWFLNPKQDTRSSFYMEDVVTEFQVQGLELDWACVVWDADLRKHNDRWGHFSFCGDRWNQVRKTERQEFLKNAYRVLLTRARQGMVIVVPDGDPTDPTRAAQLYDPTFDYLQSVGIKVL